MPNGLSFAIVWADVDLLEVELSVRFAPWAGAERMYVTREEMTAFAQELLAVAAGANQASLDIGQPDLGYGQLRLFEYAGPRRLGFDIVLGHAGGIVSNQPDRARSLRISVPIERGHCEECAAGIAAIVAAERGIVHLPISPDWP